MRAVKLFCPLCGGFLDELPAEPPVGHPLGMSWNPAWWQRVVLCACGGRVTVSHLEGRPEVGMQVDALCGGGS
jgi:hypothetical protein